MKSAKARIRRRFLERLKKILREEFKQHRPKFTTKWLNRASVTVALNGMSRSLSAKRVCNRIADAMMESISEEIVEHGKAEIYGVCILTLGKWNKNNVLRARLCRRMKENLKKKG